MLNEYEKGVTLRTLKKLLKVQKKKLMDIDGSTIEGWDIPNMTILVEGIEKTISLVELEEVRENKVDETKLIEDDIYKESQG